MAQTNINPDNKPLAGISNEQITMPDNALKFPVYINGYLYYWDALNRLVWDNNKTNFARLQHMTENERKQLQNELKYSYQTSIYA
jgi:hypothetical protein